MSDSMRDTGPARHPVVIEFSRFRDTKSTLFDGTTEGRYLSNRLQEAFQEGWLACERRVKAALDGS